jgi:hypothetical protein
VLCLLAVAVPSHAVNLVISEGTAYIHDERVDIARDKALDSALRSAVEQTVGVMISSTTEVVNFEVKLDQILSESKGFINSYTITSEDRDGDLLKVTVEADIGIGKLRDRMAALRLIMTRKSMPRLMIIFSKGTQADLIAESTMSKYFMRNGFKVIDAETVKENIRHERLQALAADNKAVKKLGHRYGAEVVIIGGIESSARSVKVDNVEMQFNKALGSAKAVNVDTGEVIATESDTRSAPGLGAAEKTIIEEIGETIAANMMDQIIDRWSSELTNTVTVKLLASGIKSYKELSKFKRIVKNEVRGVKRLFQRSYARGRVELDVEIKGTTQSLADDLVAVKVKGRNIRILEITQNRLDIKLVP